MFARVTAMIPWTYCVKEWWERFTRKAECIACVTKE